MTSRVAAIDCGTNSLRLLIADIDPAARELTDVRRQMEIVRLGQGVDATGRLAPEALERTMRVLATYAAQIADAGVSAVRMVATSATRDASNAAEFAGGVQQVLGVPPEVISGDEEAMLSFAGATAELGGGAGGPGLDPPYLVLDIGGGSTEFVLGAQRAAAPAELAAISVNVGCVRLTERHLHGDPPSAAEVAAANADTDRALDEAEAAIAVHDARTLVGLAGTVTTLTAIALEQPAYDASQVHHARLSAQAVHELAGRLITQSKAERASIPSLHPGRVDVIGAGGLILDRVMQRFGFGELVTSEHDILDGIAWSIAARQ